MNRRLESGYAATLFAGIFTLLIIFVSLILNVLQYYRAKSRVESRAYQVAAYAASFLPNPKEVALHAVHMHEMLKLNLVTGKNSGVDQQIKVWFTSAKGDRTSWTDLSGINSPEDVADDQWIGPDGVVELPIKSVTIQVSEQVPFQFVNLGTFSGDKALLPMTVVAESTAQMIPTDIAVVVENSNSLISPFKSSPPPPWPQAFVDQGWNNLNFPPNCTTEPGCKNKAQRYTEQCFGENAFEFKRGALTLYDLLSSVGTYRVGVIHTMAAGTEQGHVAVPLGTHPYIREYDPTLADKMRNSTNINYGDPDRCDDGYINDCGFGIDVDPNAGAEPNPGSHQSVHPVMIEQPFGIADHPSTRCARLTEDSAFGVPKHLFSPYFAAVGSLMARELTEPFPTTWFMPHAHFDKFGAPHLSFCPSNAIPASGVNSSVDTEECHTSPLPTIHLLPREILWMKNSGYSSAMGQPLPNYTYGTPQFGVLRAIDMLENAPERRDGLPVRRKIVIVLTDGFEDVTKPQYKNFTFPFKPQVHVNSILSSGKIEEFTAGDVGQTFCDDPSFEDPSKTLPEDSKYKIESRSTLEEDPGDQYQDNLDGIKLYTLFFGHSGANPGDSASDPFQASLTDHYVNPAFGPGVSKLKSFRDGCLNDRVGNKTSNGLRRGRVWVENSVLTNKSDPKSFADSSVPTLARSILVSENVN